MKRLVIHIVFFFLTGKLLLAQAIGKDSLVIHLQPCLQNEALRLNEESFLDDQLVSIETLKFYLSHFSLLKSGEVIWKEKDSYYLIDAAELSSLQIKLAVPNKLAFDQVQFNLGIDSITNISGAMGGDLDPTKGMYWAWNSGYINFKLEGTSSLCNSRNNQFQFHLGGYMVPFQSIQTVQLNIDSKKEIIIKTDITKFLDHLDLREQYKIMSPGVPAKQLALTASTIFYIDEKE